MVCHCHNSFLLFCQLSVLSERIVPSFQDHVTFYPLEGLMDAYNIHPLVTIYALLLYVFWTLRLASIQVVFLCINGYFHVLPSVLSVLSISHCTSSHPSSGKVVLFSHNSIIHRISRMNCKNINSLFFISRHSILLMTTISIMLPDT